MYGSNVGNQTANILIVDDTTSNLVILAEMIKSIGYIARPVTSVKQALAAITVKKPQLTLSSVEFSAEIKIIGISFIVGSCFKISQKSKPSISKKFLLFLSLH